MGVKELERLEAQAEKAGAFVNDYRVVGFVFAKEVISGVIAERDALAARLEMDPDHGIPDGIDCRNATIEMQDAQISALAAKLAEAEGACKHLAQQLVSVERERDAMAAKLAELEGQTDNLLSTCHRLALELECLLLDTKDSAPVSRWWDSAMVALDEWHKSKDLVSARPVPAEPVNARLLEAIKRLSFCAQTTGGTAGRDEELCAAIGEAEKAIAAAEAQQERILQDMHDAGREIDRVMAEAAPKAVRLTEAEVAAELNLFPHPSSLVLKITRAIETAVLRKNGIKVAE